MSEAISSKRNPRLRELKRLHERKHRRERGLFVAEGEDLVAEALRYETAPVAVFSVRGAGLPFVLPEGTEHVEATAAALSAVSSLGSGSRIIGVFRQRWWSLEETAAPSQPDRRLGSLAEPDRRLGAGRPYIYLHDVSDPGNVGAVLRAAHAFGAAAVLLSERVADPYGPKAVRASMGAIFAVPVVRISLAEAREGLGARAVALVPHEGRPIRGLDLAEPVLLAFGGERTGLTAELAGACDETAHIPLAPDGAESLNVAMAVTLCLYESALHRLSDHDE
jgi:RNA methyltransferase, TrmH family